MASLRCRAARPTDGRARGRAARKPAGIGPWRYPGARGGPEVVSWVLDEGCGRSRGRSSAVFGGPMTRIASGSPRTILRSSRCTSLATRIARRKAPCIRPQAALLGDQSTVPDWWMPTQRCSRLSQPHPPPTPVALRLQPKVSEGVGAGRLLEEAKAMRVPAPLLGAPGSGATQAAA